MMQPQPNEPCDPRCERECEPGTNYGATDRRGDPIPFVCEGDVSHGDYTAAEVWRCLCEHHGAQ